MFASVGRKCLIDSLSGFSDIIWGVWPFERCDPVTMRTYEAPHYKQGFAASRDALAKRKQTASAPYTSPMSSFTRVAVHGLPQPICPLITATKLLLTSCALQSVRPGRLMRASILSSPYQRSQIPQLPSYLSTILPPDLPSMQWPSFLNRVGATAEDQCIRSYARRWSTVPPA
jgi:hypothetical protein